MSSRLDPTDLDAMLKRLHLPTVRRLYPELAIRAESEGMSYRGFLEIHIRLLERGTHYVLRSRSYWTRHQKADPPRLSEDAA